MSTTPEHNSNSSQRATASAAASASAQVFGETVSVATPRVTTKRDSFPLTQRGWLVAQLAQGTDGLARINNYVMETYSEPLSNYVAGSSFRSMGSAKDLVSGFFASRLSQLGYFERWIESELPLRRWLINGFLFHLQEETRRIRTERVDALPTISSAEPATSEHDAVEQFDRLWAASMVRSAAGNARERCATEGFAMHWDMFERHFIGGLSYSGLSLEFTVTGGQAASMVRTASIRFRQAVVDLLLRDGATEDELDEEVTRLMRALRP